MAESHAYLFKFIVIGEAGVGKSCLLSRLQKKEFPKMHEPTVGVEFLSMMLNVQGIPIKIHVWDTAGQEAYRSVTRSFYRSAIGGIIVYDITNRESFQSVTDWVREANEYGNRRLSLILVGNKSDLQNERQVTYEEGQELARQNNMAFAESSAKDGANVEKTFYDLAESVLQKIKDKKIDITDEYSGVRKGNAFAEYTTSSASTSSGAGQAPQRLNKRGHASGGQAAKKNKKCC